MLICVYVAPQLKASILQAILLASFIVFSGEHDMFFVLYDIEKMQANYVGPKGFPALCKDV